MEQGLLAIILHAHLPFVRHSEYPEFLEEDWLFEAISETYIPVLQVLERCAAITAIS
jgi:1,4-alpha-glucan branching enzyme